MNDENENDGIEDAVFEERADGEGSAAVEAQRPSESGETGLAMPSSEERTLAAVAHGVGVASSLLLPVVISAIIYGLKGEESEFVRIQAREALNFQITTAIGMVGSFVLVFCGIGIFMMWFLALASFILAIVGAIKVYNGELYRYPVNLRLIS